MDAHDAVINLQGVGYQYPDGSRVLDKLDFHVHPGQKLGIIGANGCGKTTMLQIIMGLLPEYTGTVQLFGQAMEGEKSFKKARPKLGYVFQNADDQLFSPTVLEDVAFGPLNLGKTPEEAKQIARKTLDQLRLTGFEDRISYRLSGGEKRLVALATVMAMEPEVLLLDEPTTGLDPATYEHITHVLNDLAITLVIVSHEYEFLRNTTKDFFGMEKGRITYNGDSSALHTHTHIHPMGQHPHKH